MSCLLTFFVTSSRATKFRSETKKKLESDFKEGILIIFLLFNNILAYNHFRWTEELDTSIMQWRHGYSTSTLVYSRRWMW